jgi:ATP-binding cassette subfamily G (WHITE) protein 2 (PDR)
MAVLIFFCWYYPIGLYRNAEPTDAVHLRGFQLFLFVWMFLIFTSTFTHMVIAGVESAENGGNIANLMFTLCLLFCGVLAQPSDFPRFWIFMYRLSPFTYLVSGMLSVGLANSSVNCADRELIVFEPLSGETCGQYMKTYQSMLGGKLVDDAATTNCQFCSVSDTNVFLKSISSDYSQAWRNFGTSPSHLAF